MYVVINFSLGIILHINEFLSILSLLLPKLLKFLPKKGYSRWFKNLFITIYSHHMNNKNATCDAYENDAI